MMQHQIQELEAFSQMDKTHSLMFVLEIPMQTLTIIHHQPKI